MDYQADFAQTFLMLFGIYIDVVAGAIIACGLIMAAAWAIISQISRRL